MTTLSELRELMARLTAALNELDDGVVVNVEHRVAELLSQHSEHVAECEDRLRRCAALLQDGLRDEAVDFARDEPALLDAAHVLDLQSRPEWLHWAGALALRGFPLPIAPSVKIAYKLREEEDRLIDLKTELDTWRRLNLAGRPLAARIEALRSLHKRDPDSAAWVTCLREHERQRLMEIEAEAGAAEKRSDSTTLATLLGELTPVSKWIEDVPSRLVNLVRAADKRVWQAESKRQLATVGAGLALAFEARDREAVGRLRDAWRQLVADLGDIDTADETIQKAHDAVEWFDRHDRFEGLCEEIAHTLDERPADWRQRCAWGQRLERMRAEVESLAEQLHDEVPRAPLSRLCERVARALDDLRSERSRRTLLRGLGLVTGTAVVLGIGFVANTIVRQNDQVRAAIAQLDETERRLSAGEEVGDEVERLVARWPMWLSEDPVVAGQIERTKQTAREEERRRERAAEARAAIDDRLAQVQPGSRPDPLAPWPDAFAAATQELVRLADGGLAKTERERADVVRAQGRVESVAKSLQRRADEFVRGEVAEFQRRLALLEPQQRKDPLGTSRAVTEIVADIDALQEAADAIACPMAAQPFNTWRITGDEALRQVQPGSQVRKTAATLTDATESLSRFERRKEELGAALGDWQRYQALLRSLAEEFPDQAESREYREVAGDAAVWQAIEEWNRFVGELEPWAELSSQQAVAAASRIEKLSADTKKLDFVAGFVARAEPAIRAMNRDMRALSLDLHEWVKREWLLELEWTVVQPTNAGAAKIFYCLKKPDLSLGGFKFQRQWKVQGLWPPAESVNNLRGTSIKGNEQVKRSPQAELADEIERQCILLLPDHVPGLKFDAMILRCAELVEQAGHVDPLLRIVNLRKFLKTGRDNCDTFRGDRMAGLWSRLSDDEGNIEGLSIEQITTFLDPERDANRGYQLAIKQADRLLAVVRPVLDDVRRRIENDRAFLNDPGVSTYECVGRLDRSPEGRVVFVPRPSGRRATDIFVATGDGRMQPVGRFGRNGEFLPEVGRSMRAGSPCYVLRARGSVTLVETGEGGRQDGQP